ncbi:MAG: serine hydrolase domain-containing protein [Saccharofermentanales bacterium]
MDLKTQSSSLALIRKIFDTRASTIPRITIRSGKPSCQTDLPVLQPFLRTSPESQGVSSDYLVDFLEEFRSDATLDPHSIMILRNGAVICEGAFGAYDLNVWHITHSLCKSITGLAIGILIGDGKLSLDDKAVKILEKNAPKIAILTHINITVRHLLTMTSGIVFNEAGAVTEKDWIRCFFESSVLTEPGRQFAYNSMNTYILSAIIKEVSGQGLTDFLQDRLFGPMGITGVFWEKCPKGIEKGGWGLYIRPEDAAKIGQLVLQKGRWGGLTLVPRSWIDEAVTMHATTPASMGGYNYGYQIWVGRERNTFLFNGMFGQNILGFPDTRLLIVINAGNNELFQQSRFFSLAERYFAPDYCPGDALPENPDALGRLRRLQSNLNRGVVDSGGSAGDSEDSAGDSGGSVPGTFNTFNKLSLRHDELLSFLEGRIYQTDDSAASAVGLLPLLAQMVQNNYTRGFRSLGFNAESGNLVLTVTEADEIYRFAVGFDKPAYTDLSFHGEPYRVGVTGVFTTDEDDRLVLKVRISFLEIANARLIKIFFADDSIAIRWSESPGKPFITGAIAAIRNEIKLYPILEKVITRADGDFMHYKFKCLMEPEITATPADS